MADTKFAWGDSGYINGSAWQPDPTANGTGGLYQGFSYGVAVTALSLGTNLFTTVAVAVKAWCAALICNRCGTLTEYLQAIKKSLETLRCGRSQGVSNGKGVLVTCGVRNDLLCSLGEYWTLIDLESSSGD